MRASRSTPTSRFSGQYADDGKQVRRAAREAAGNRCVRCLHPFESGKHGKGEWSPCDEQCRHHGPLRVGGKVEPVSDFSEYAGQLVLSGWRIDAKWRILTIHHANGDKADDWWDNLLPLCQRCHLVIQGKVDPRVPWMFEHSPWMRVYAAAWNARKYEGKKVTREEAQARMEELLAYECRVKSAPEFPTTT